MIGFATLVVAILAAIGLAAAVRVVSGYIGGALRRRRAARRRARRAGQVDFGVRPAGTGQLSAAERSRRRASLRSLPPTGPVSPARQRHRGRRRAVRGRTR